ncbi:MAG: hypothetical protein QG646_1641 [Euryarchaeota archaeon]|nr:hypothetical protein [Euryarchaeota archaeon]
MLVDGKNVVILYLENWQRRMIKDFLGVECDIWEFPVEEADNMKYGSPFPSSKFKRMYLTGWQMRELRDEAGITCDFVELTKEIIPKYRVSPK